MTDLDTLLREVKWVLGDPRATGTHDSVLEAMGNQSTDGTVIYELDTLTKALNAAEDGFEVDVKSSVNVTIDQITQDVTIDEIKTGSMNVYGYDYGNTTWKEIRVNADGKLTCTI